MRWHFCDGQNVRAYAASPAKIVSRRDIAGRDVAHVIDTDKRATACVWQRQRLVRIPVGKRRSTTPADNDQIAVTAPEELIKRLCVAVGALRGAGYRGAD
ncbi:hypothetical protein D3C87_1804880 [compost metagenome]